MLKELENMTYEEALEEFSVQSFFLQKKKKKTVEMEGVQNLTSSQQRT